MATLASTNLTLLDLATRTNCDGAVMEVVEALSLSNPMIQDAAFQEGNLTAGHKSVIRTGLPTGTWRLMNYGVQPEKTTTQPVIDTTGMLEAYSEVDKALVQLNNQRNAWRRSEDLGFVEGLGQNVAQTMLYGNTGVDPEKFMGLAPRFNSLAAGNGDQIVDAGGTGSTNTSAWIITWGDQTVFGIYPKGSQVGLQVEDLGQDTKVLADGSMFEVLRTHFKWDIGLVVRDWRYVVRIANIDVADFADAGAVSGYTGPDVGLFLIEAMNRLYSLNAPGRTVIYVSRALKAALDKLATRQANVHLQLGQWMGQPTLMFWGFPIRVLDSILNTEARVV